MVEKEISMYKRYWVYSETEAGLLQKTNQNLNYDKMSLGKVINENGIIKNFTSIVSKKSNIRYSDSIIVMEGDIRQVRYTSPQFE